MSRSQKLRKQMEKVWAREFEKEHFAMLRDMAEMTRMGIRFDPNVWDRYQNKIVPPQKIPVEQWRLRLNLSGGK